MISIDSTVEIPKGNELFIIYYLQASFTWDKQSSSTNFQAPYSVLLLLLLVTSAGFQSHET